MHNQMKIENQLPDYIIDNWKAAGHHCDHEPPGDCEGRYHVCSPTTLDYVTIANGEHSYRFQPIAFTAETEYCPHRREHRLRALDIRMPLREGLQFLPGNLLSSQERVKISYVTRNRSGDGFTRYICSCRLVRCIAVDMGPHSALDALWRLDGLQTEEAAMLEYLANVRE
jgi:hypothetical protein